MKSFGLTYCDAENENTQKRKNLRGSKLSGSLENDHLFSAFMQYL